MSFNLNNPQLVHSICTCIRLLFLRQWIPRVINSRMVNNNGKRKLQDSSSSSLALPCCTSQVLIGKLNGDLKLAFFVFLKSLRLFLCMLWCSKSAACAYDGSRYHWILAIEGLENGELLLGMKTTKTMQEWVLLNFSFSKNSIKEKFVYIFSVNK